MKVLVTGSSGFIGRWVGRQLHASGMQWYGLDIDNAADHSSASGFFHVDIRNRNALKQVLVETAPDAVIHLAARCGFAGATLQDYDANVGGVRNLCEAVAVTPSVQRVVYTSSQLVCEVGHVPASDTDYRPNTVYGRSKVRTEEIVREYEGGSVEWCIGRPTTVWGPGMKPHYQTLLRAIQRGIYFHSGSGELYKSYGYAANVAHQYVRLLQAPATAIHGEIFYLADYEPLSLRAYTDGLQQHLGARPIPTVPLPVARLLARLGDTLGALGIDAPYHSFLLRNIRTEYIFDLSNTEQVCGQLPYDFESGVRETAEWFRRGANIDDLGAHADGQQSSARVNATT